jgi:hypothetical protein
VLDVVFHSLAAGGDHLGGNLGGGSVHEPHFRRHLRLAVDDDEALAAGEAHGDEEAFVVLLVDQGVACRRRAQAVAPHLERPHGAVGTHIEEVGPAGGPRRAVVDALDHVGPVAARDQVPEAQGVELGPVVVVGVGDDALVGADVEHAEGEVVVVAGQLVLVQDQFAVPGPGGGQGAGGVQPAVGVGQAPVGGVLAALVGAGPVPPLPTAGGGGHVVFLDPGPDGLVQPVLKPGRRLQHGGRVLVLGLQVGGHVGVVALAEPVPVVNSHVAVGFQAVGPAGSGGRTDAGRRREGHGARLSRPAPHRFRWGRLWSPGGGLTHPCRIFRPDSVVSQLRAVV